MFNFALEGHYAQFYGKHIWVFTGQLQIGPVAIVALIWLVSVADNFQTTHLSLNIAVLCKFFEFGDAKKDSVTQE